MFQDMGLIIINYYHMEALKREQTRNQISLAILHLYDSPDQIVCDLGVVDEVREIIRMNRNHALY